MTLPRLYQMGQYWRDHPPLHILVGAFFGVKSADQKQIEKKEESIDQMIADLGMAGLKMEN